MTVKIEQKNKGDVITFSMPNSEDEHVGIILESFDREAFLMEFLSWRYLKNNGMAQMVPGSHDLIDSAIIDKHPAYKVMVGDKQYLLYTSDGEEYKGISS